MRNKSSLRRRRRGAVPILCVVAFLGACLLFVYVLSPVVSAFSVLLSGDRKASLDVDAWNLTLVNRTHEMPGNYHVEFTELSNGIFVDSRIYPALQEMLDDMRKDGLYPVVVSGYRSREQQEALFNENVAAYERDGYDAETACSLALNVCAMPGFSEHELGSAVDINADPAHSRGQDVYDWLKKNACRYGFICRYPENKTAVTGIADEPWHYRYVGKEAATEIQQYGLCLEEYVSMLSHKNIGTQCDSGCRFREYV